MELFSIIIAIVFLAGFVLLFAKRTMLSVTDGYSSIWSFIFYKEVIFIFMPLVLLSIYPVSYFSGLKMVDQSLVFNISIWVIFSFFAYFILYVFLLRSVFGWGLFDVSEDELVDQVNKRKIILFSIASIVSGASLLLGSILFLGYSHAFFVSIITGTNVLHVRLENAYSSGLPSQIAYVISFSYWVSAIFSAYLLFAGSRVGGLMVFITGLILATASGAKAPVVQYIMLCVMAYMYIARPKVSATKLLFLLPFYVAMIIVLIYYVVSLQIPDLDIPLFWQYLVGRLGVGQMAGVYETLSIGFHSSEYGWHMVPFASLFVDYPIFSKELMLFSEGRDYTATGVKNSLFIAEAYGIGGFLLMAISPFIMAFAYIIKGFLLFYSLRYFFSEIVAKVYFLPVFFLSTKLTGDFSSFVFQKGTILLLLVLGLVYLVKVAINPFLKWDHFA